MASESPSEIVSRSELEGEQTHLNLLYDRVQERRIDAQRRTAGPAGGARSRRRLLRGGVNPGSQRVRLMFRATTALEALRWATVNAAEAIGLGDRIGGFTPGKRADLHAAVAVLPPAPPGGFAVIRDLASGNLSA